MATAGTPTVIAPTAQTVESTGTAFDNLTTFTFAPIASMTIKTTTEEVFTFLPLETSTKALPSPTAKPSTEQSTPDGEVTQKDSVLTTESSATSSVTVAGGSTTEKASATDQVEKPDKAESTESSEVTFNALTTERSRVTGSTSRDDDSEVEGGGNGDERHATSSGSNESSENDSNLPSNVLTTKTTDSDGFPHNKVATQSSDESSDEDNRKDPHEQLPQPQQPPSSTDDSVNSDEKTGNDLDMDSQSPPLPDPLEVTSPFPQTEDNEPTETSKTSPLLDFAYFNDRNESKVANDSRKPRLRNFFYYYFLTAIRVNESRERELNRTFEEAGHDRLWGLPGDRSVLRTNSSVLLAAARTCDAIFHNLISTFSAPTQKTIF